MFNIVILAVGKIKEKHWRTAAEEYLARLRPYAKILVEEVAAESWQRISDKEKAKDKEGERLLKFLEKYSGSEIILLDESGKQFSSREFSQILNRASGRIVFVIGGALGFSEKVKNSLRVKLSLSKMTLPHELARVVLLEQIYRAATIILGKAYHY